MARGTEVPVEEPKAHRSAYEAIIRDGGGPDAMAKGTEFEGTIILIIAINTIERACELSTPGLNAVRTIIVQDYGVMFETRPPQLRKADVSSSSPIRGIEPFQRLSAFQTIGGEQAEELFRMLQLCLLYRGAEGDLGDAAEEILEEADLSRLDDSTRY